MCHTTTLERKHVATTRTAAKLTYDQEITFAKWKVFKLRQAIETKCQSSNIAFIQISKTRISCILWQAQNIKINRKLVTAGGKPEKDNENRQHANGTRKNVEKTYDKDITFTNKKQKYP